MIGYFRTRSGQTRVLPVPGPPPPAVWRVPIPLVEEVAVRTHYHFLDTLGPDFAEFALVSQSDDTAWYQEVSRLE